MQWQLLKSLTKLTMIVTDFCLLDANHDVDDVEHERERDADHDVEHEREQQHEDTEQQADVNEEPSDDEPSDKEEISIDEPSVQHWWNLSSAAGCHNTKSKTSKRQSRKEAAGFAPKPREQKLEERFNARDQISKTKRGKILKQRRERATTTGTNNDAYNVKEHKEVKELIGSLAKYTEEEIEEGEAGNAYESDTDVIGNLENDWFQCMEAAAKEYAAL